MNAANTGVAVVDGAVTRSGTIVSYPEGSLAEMAVLRVRGVAAIAGVIAIRAWWDAPTDTDTVDVKGAAWAIFQELRLQFDGVLPARVVHQCVDRPVLDPVGSVGVEALPKMAVRLARVRLEPHSSAT